MKLVTVQHKKVLETLLNNNIYRNDFKYIIKSPFDNLDVKEELKEKAKVEAYQILMRHYCFSSPPIFCCVVDRLADFTHTNISKNSVLLELDVPDDLIKLHLLSTWDSILYNIYNKSWTDILYNNVFRKALDGEKTEREELNIQAVISYIHPDWLTGYYNVPEDFDDIYFSRKILKEFDYKRVIDEI